MERRTLLKVAAVSPLAAPFVARSARAASKDIIYLTPGLDLVFTHVPFAGWRSTFGAL